MGDHGAVLNARASALKFKCDLYVRPSTFDFVCVNYS
jgi:hypothetical protein